MRARQPAAMQIARPAAQRCAVWWFAWTNNCHRVTTAAADVRRLHCDPGYVVGRRWVGQVKLRGEALFAGPALNGVADVGNGRLPPLTGRRGAGENLLERGRDNGGLIEVSTV